MAGRRGAEGRGIRRGGGRGVKSDGAKLQTSAKYIPRAFTPSSSGSSSGGR